MQNSLLLKQKFAFNFPVFIRKNGGNFLLIFAEAIFSHNTPYKKMAFQKGPILKNTEIWRFDMFI